METSSVKQAKGSNLTINGGSSSIKFALFEASDSRQRILAGSSGEIELPKIPGGLTRFPAPGTGFSASDRRTHSLTAGARSTTGWDRPSYSSPKYPAYHRP